MPISIVCPSCSTRLKAPDRLAGAAVRCPKCSAWAPVSAVAGGPNHHPPEGRRGGGCAMLLLCLSLLVNIGLIGGFLYLGFTDSLDKVGWFWDKLPVVGRSPESRAEQIIKDQIKLTNDVAEALEKAKDKADAEAKLKEWGSASGDLTKKSIALSLSLSDEEAKKVMDKAREKHAEDLGKAQTRMNAAFIAAFAKYPGLTMPSMPGLGGFGGGPRVGTTPPADPAKDLVKQHVKALKDLATSLQEITANTKPGDPTVDDRAKARIEKYAKTAAALETKAKALSDEGKKSLAAALKDKDRAKELRRARSQAEAELRAYPSLTAPNLDPLGSTSPKDDG